MKIIKRSGAEVEFDPAKIIIAVTKTNESVVPSERMSEIQIKRIAEDAENAPAPAPAARVDAIAFGTAHGFYTAQPKLDFDVVKNVAKAKGLPLVMHGGSGVSPEDYKKVIELGIRKINYYTYMAKAGGAGVVALADKTFYHDITVAAKDAMEKDVIEAIKLFS